MINSAATEQVAGWLGNHAVELLPNATSLRSLPSIPPETPHSITNLQSETIDQTVNFALSVQGLGRNVVPHVSATRIGREKAHEVGTLLRDREIGEVFVMSGDNDGDVVTYATTLDLLEDWHGANIVFNKIGIVGHPEGLDGVSDAVLDQALIDKQEFADSVGVEMYVVTQLCFDPLKVTSWVQNARKAGLHLPIFIGLPGPISIEKLARYSEICRVGGSVEYLQLDVPVLNGDEGEQNFDPQKFLREVAVIASELDNVQGTYFFTFNQPAETAEWLRGVQDSNPS
jgi:methylenetetrahydrofolate reductase (NADPH)